ncbi:hypothetical protein RvY_02610 [Ramazzottius varieornatus]|uniref:Uncharacterized protein n=1 Tax=Ramazzottius varieornatus TaxID=947166 RepID=A0A1D1UKB1_RAMVA|nr:hypothetical protein RvY_02610 [Ramazzottius varieornatus]
MITGRFSSLLCRWIANEAYLLQNIQVTSPQRSWIATSGPLSQKAKRFPKKNPKIVLTRHTEDAPIPETHSTQADLKRAWKAKLAQNKAAKLDYVPVPSEYYVDIKDPAFADRIAEFLVIFTRADIDQIALHTPKAFVQPFKETYKIIQYITMKMGQTPAHIVQAGAFDFPLEHIIKRHLFAERCGVYQMVTLKNPELAELNPSLARLLRTTDAKFAKLVGVSLEEYEVFSEMFEQNKSRLMDIDSFEIEEEYDVGDGPDFRSSKEEPFMLN